MPLARAAEDMSDKCPTQREKIAAATARLELVDQAVEMSLAELESVVGLSHDAAVTLRQTMLMIRRARAKMALVQRRVPA